MKKTILLLVGILLTSCTAESIAQEEVKQQSVAEIKTNTFTVVWSSNQESPYVEFNKHTFTACDEYTTITELHRENKFKITLENNQKFDIQIKREGTVKNAELYLAIFKGEDLQYEKEVDTNGFVLISFVDSNGNIGKVKY